MNGQTNFDTVVHWPIHRWASGIKAFNVCSVGDKIYLLTDENKVGIRLLCTLLLYGMSL